MIILRSNNLSQIWADRLRSLSDKTYFKVGRSKSYISPCILSSLKRIIDFFPIMARWESSHSGSERTLTMASCLIKTYIPSSYNRSSMITLRYCSQVKIRETQNVCIKNMHITLIIKIIYYHLLLTNLVAQRNWNWNL